MDPESIRRHTNVSRSRKCPTTLHRDPESIVHGVTVGRSVSQHVSDVITRLSGTDFPKIDGEKFSTANMSQWIPLSCTGNMAEDAGKVAFKSEPLDRTEEESLTDEVSMYMKDLNKPRYLDYAGQRAWDICGEALDNEIMIMKTLTKWLHDTVNAFKNGNTSHQQLSRMMDETMQLLENRENARLVSCVAHGDLCKAYDSYIRERLSEEKIAESVNTERQHVPPPPPQPITSASVTAPLAEGQQRRGFQPVRAKARKRNRKKRRPNDSNNVQNVAERATSPERWQTPTGLVNGPCAKNGQKRERETERPDEPRGTSEHVSEPTPKRRRTEGEVLVISRTGEKSHEAILRTLKQKLTPEKARIDAVRRSREGDIHLVLEKGASRESVNVLRMSLAKAAGKEARVRRLREMADLEVKNIGDDVGDSREIIRALTGLPGVEGVSEEDVTVHFLRTSSDRSKTAVLTVPVELVEVACKLGTIRIGWNMCRVNKRDVSIRCFKCQELGHVAAVCKGKDRTRMCRRCSVIGHSASGCTAPPRCDLCVSAGLREHAHSIGDRKCSFWTADTGNARNVNFKR